MKEGYSIGLRLFELTTRYLLKGIIQLQTTQRQLQPCWTPRIYLAGQRSSKSII